MQHFCNQKHTTIADFVADLRAPTPSAGAELAVYDLSELFDELDSLQYRLHHAMEWKAESIRNRYQRLSQSLALKSPKYQLNEKRQYALNLEEKLEQKICGRINEMRYRLGMLAERLEGVSPAKKLSQGLAFVTDQNGKRISRVLDAEPGDEIKIRLQDGMMTADVRERKVNV